MAAVIGFDFGNLNGVIATARSGGIEILANEYSYRLTPNVVCMGTSRRYIGEAGRTQMINNLKHTVSDFKMLLGRKYSDVTVQREIKNLTCDHEAGPNDEILLKLRTPDGIKTFTPEQIAAMYLGQLKKTAERELNRPILDCVISVPCWFNNDQRLSVQLAAKSAGLNCVRTFNDTTAVSLAYGIYKQDLPEDKPRVVAIVDMGHASLQVTLTAFLKGKLTVLAALGDSQCGGRDLDELLFEKFRAEFQAKHKVDIAEKPKSKARMMVEVEKLKKSMSLNTHAIPINIECLFEDYDFNSKIFRQEFEDMGTEYKKKVSVLLDNLMKTSKVPISRVDAVEIIGGSTRVPFIKQAIIDFFQVSTVNTTINADEGIARGCALQAAILSPTFRVRDFSIADVTPYAIDLTWISPKDRQEVSQSLYAANNTIPSNKVITLNRKEDFDVTAVYSFPQAVVGHQKHISTYRISGAKPDANNETVRCKIVTTVNANGIFDVTGAYWVEEITEIVTSEIKAEDDVNMDEPKTDDSSMASDSTITEVNGIKTKKTIVKHPLTVTCLSGVPEALVNSFFETECALKSHDTSEEERLAAKNAVEEYAYELKDKVNGQYASFVTSEELQEANGLANDAENWLYDDGEFATKSAYNERYAAMKAVGDRIAFRATEAELRPAAMQALEATFTQATSYIQAADMRPAEFAYLPADKVGAFKAAVAAKSSWYANVCEDLKSLAKTSNPVIRHGDFLAAKQEIDAHIAQLQSVPKPAPATPAQEESSASAQDDDSAMCD